MAAFKQEIWKLTKKSEEWGRIAEATEDSLPKWATRPKSDEERETYRRAWKLVSATLPFPSKGDSACQLIDLTRGSEVRVCLRTCS
jgi:hypothetical protein